LERASPTPLPCIAWQRGHPQKIIHNIPGGNFEIKGNVLYSHALLAGMLGLFSPFGSMQAGRHEPKQLSPHPSWILSALPN
ncbi:MAG: hypothetical protein NZM35_09990, partial [Chitinophagales bacterium]|nr:hypothetical protein [Chitinophagales bacterium]MDW8419608.1 hypothetical protein [Chitinophagales bacterium]